MKEERTYYDPVARVHFTTTADLSNPVTKPKLVNPARSRNGNGNRNRGNLPYLRFRRRLRKDVFGKK